MSSPLPGTAPPGPLLPAGNPRIVGIVNITEDSFSDGGRYLDPAVALAHARKLRAEGADIIELGPAASHPDSAPVSVAEERRRLAPVLEQLAADGVPVSVDSFLPETLRFAISAGAACLNDIHGFGDPGLYPLLAASRCRLVVMHAVQAAGPATRVVTDPATVRDGIFRFFARRLAALQAAGIGRDRLVVDPGLGYFLGSTPGPSLAALAGIRELKAAFGVPVLVSPSRKSFLHALTGKDVIRSGPATLAAEIFAAWQGADYIRTHDVAAARDALTFLAAITREAGHAQPRTGQQGRGHHAGERTGPKDGFMKVTSVAPQERAGAHMNDVITPFRVGFSGADVDDLRERLRRARWPEPATAGGWSQGTPLAWIRELCRHWLEDYDFAAAQERLNQFPQFRTAIDGLDICFVHVRSPRPGAVPLLLTHGWPGSVVEFRKVIGPLADPVTHGGDAADAFHVVCPALPGFGFSGKPAEPGWGLARIADAWDQLMNRLGYPRYGAQGGDWGARVTIELARRHPASLAGIHLNMVPAIPAPGTEGNDLTERERDALDTLARHRGQGQGYVAIQSTRPQTIGYGLVDSPAALAAWIGEKYQAWSDNDGDPSSVFTREEMLDNIMLYWLPATGASAARIYWETAGKLSVDPVTVPAGCSIFPGEFYRPSRRWAQRVFPDLRYWNELDKGGHFAALEQPDAFTGEVRAAFRAFR